MSETFPATSPLDQVEMAGSALQPESLREGLRRQRQENLENTTVDIPLPEFDNPQLVGRYHFVDTDVMEKMGKRIMTEFKSRSERTVYAAVDSIIEACDGLFAKLPDSEELIPLDTDIPMTYDSRLAEYLGFESTTARDVVFQVFGGNTYAILDHSMKITKWMGNRKADLGDDGLGEM